MKLTDSLTVETELFEHREVKANFINPFCFGEDFAGWLRDASSPLAAEGFELSKPVQEDYGWGFWATRGKDSYWVSMGYTGDGPQDASAEWVVSVDYDPGLSVWKRLFHKPDAAGFARVRDRVFDTLRGNAGIRVIEEA